MIKLINGHLTYLCLYKVKALKAPEFKKLLFLIENLTIKHQLFYLFTNSCL